VDVHKQNLNERCGQLRLLKCRNSSRIGRDGVITPELAPANQLDDGIGGTLVSARGVELTLRLKMGPARHQSASGSVRSECGIESLEQGRVAEWLEQALDRTLFE